MKVVHIITRLIIGGAQENTLLNCEDLARIYGDDVLLVTGPTTGPEGSLMRRLQGDKDHAPLPYRVVPSLIRPIRPWSDLRAYHSICRILRDFKPDVVHTHSAKAGILGRLAARATRVPAIVHSVHGAPFWPEQNRFIRFFYRWCERFAAKRCDAFICVADAMSDLMVDAKVAPREMFTTVFSGMEVEPFLESTIHRHAARKRLGFAEDEIVVGKIARLFELKGHEYVIAAARRVLDQIPKVRFLFIGDGILTEKYRRDIGRLGLSDRFTFTGLVQPNEIPALISATDIVVHASLREGLARVLPQALLSGKPVISYDVDGAREVVVNDETGFLLPPKSVDSLADAIIRLARDASLRECFGRTGRERFQTQFDHRYMSERIREIYCRLLNR